MVDAFHSAIPVQLTLCACAGDMHAANNRPHSNPWVNLMLMSVFSRCLVIRTEAGAQARAVHATHRKAAVARLFPQARTTRVLRRVADARSALHACATLSAPPTLVREKL